MVYRKRVPRVTASAETSAGAAVRSNDPQASESSSFRPLNSFSGVSSPGSILALQRMIGNAAVGQLIQSARLESRTATGHATIQRAWNPETYQVDNSQRTLHVDTRQVSWGATQGAGQFQHHKDTTNRPRTILFETISTERGVVGLLNRLQAVNAPWDTGLTVVLNQAYTPDKVYNQQGAITTTPRTKGDPLNTAKANLDLRWNQLNNAWNGPPLEIATAAWERREKQGDNGSDLEVVQSSVPYSTLRRIAATNPGASQIEQALTSNHDQFWRKMGDDDMPFVNPNDGNHAEIGKLAEVEEQGNIYVKNTLVTFGYNLTTGGTAEPITTIVRNIYKKEMELRDQIAAVEAPMYPSEPTTYYRPVRPGSMNDPWGRMEQEQVGGSGQQLEGAKLAKAMNRGDGYYHETFHSVMADTSAGRRNDALVALLNGWWNNGNGDPSAVKDDAIDAAINQLDQNALRKNEYLGKVPGNLGQQLKQHQFKQIEAMVDSYRAAAAREAGNHLRQLLVHIASMQAKYAKTGIN